jgi:hypothetical protein
MHRRYPAHTAAVALPSAVARDAVAYLIELTEFFDVDMDEFARVLRLVATHRLGRFQRRQPVEPQARRIRLTVAGEMPRSAAI